MFSKSLAAFWLSLLLAAAAPAVAAAESEVTVGVLAYRAPAHTLEQWRPTAEYLGEVIPNRRFRVRALDYPELDAAVAAGEIDFVLTNTAHYVRLEAAHGLTRLATLGVDLQGQAVRQFGGVIFSRADSDLHHLQDLRGRRLAAVDPDSLGGYLAAWQTLNEAGLDPQHDLAALSFSGMPHDRVVWQVLAGEADVGVVRTGVLESLVAERRLELAQLRVLEPRQSTGFPLLHSTPLYPEWPFARMPHADEELAARVTVALLNLPKDHPAVIAGGYAGWSAPLNYQPVHDLFRQLRLPPYDAVAPLTLAALWARYGVFLLGLTLLVLLVSSGAALQYRRVNRALRKHQALLRFQAQHDSLTGLANRALLSERLEQAIARAGSGRGRLAVLFLDLDRFKDVNDSLGHPVGDELLQAVARRFARRLGDVGLLARLGGDEFVLLAEGAGAAAAERLAERTLEVLRAPFQLPGRAGMHVGASIGISLYPDHGGNPTELIKNADAAMYQAKDRGGNGYCFYDQSMTVAADTRMELEARLRLALAAEELVVFYQPQLRVADGQAFGVEALVRWECPERGLVPPDEFIPLAEQVGLIDAIGDYVLRTACAQVCQWHRQGLPMVLSVNLCAREFGDPRLPQRIAAVLADSGLPPASLVLEITESMLMARRDAALATLQGLKRLGVGLAIDDFGTGYSSLAYLTRFPLDQLKIDRCFVRDIPADGDATEITATVIAMGRNLGLQVVAEGVETAEQLAFLAAQGCDAYQGYFFSRPLPAAAVYRLLREEQARGLLSAAAASR